MLLTFVPVEEINEITNVEGAAINEAKKRLALKLPN